MTSIRLLKNGAEFFPAVFDAIEHARSCVALEMYYIADDGTGRELRDRLAMAAARGIQVMALVDSWGSWSLPDNFWDEVRKNGGMVRWFRPIKRGLLPFRNHRKLVLIDDRRAFIGGMNVADEYYRGRDNDAAWRDNALELEGERVARLRRSFSRMWRKADRPLSRFLFSPRLRKSPTNHTDVRNVLFLESGPDNPFRSVRRIYRQVIRDASVSIDLAMSYFYPPGRVMRALRKAVKRGVRVRLLFPEKTDVAVARWAARGLYGRLLRSGIEVWEYRPAMMHAKLAIADNTVIAGSANLDIRSVLVNYELVAVVNDAATAEHARRDFEDDLKESVRVEFDDWRKRPIIQKIKERVSYCLLARTDPFVSRMEIMKKMW